MDLLTHCFLGASVGYLVAGKKAGRRAMIVGGLSGMLPDIDILLTPFFSITEMLFVHRSITHSLLVLGLLAPFLGWFTSKLYKREPISIYQWTSLCFWAMIIHPVLDLFTTYGTGLLLPFSDGRYAISTIAVVDFLFTLPFILLLPFVFFFSTISQKYKQVINCGALILSISYLSFTVINKAHVNTVFEENLLKQKKMYAQLKTFPLIGTNFRWVVVAKTDGGFWIGKYNQMQTKPIEFSYISKNDYLVIDYENSQEIRYLKRFCKGMYAFEQLPNGDVQYNDLRYGFVTEHGKKYYLFSYRLQVRDGKVIVLQNRNISFWLRLKD